MEFLKIMLDALALDALAIQFGENANYTPIQRSFVKVQIALSLSDDLAQLNKVANDLEMEVEKMMPKSDSSESNKHLVMKAYVHFIRGGFITPLEPTTKRLEDLEKALKLVEPIKFTTEGIFAYIVTLQNSVRILMGLDNMDKALQYLTEAEELFENFKEKYPLDFDQKALNFSQIFGSRNSEHPGHVPLSNLYHHTNILLNNWYNVAKNTEMQLKYAVPFIIAHLTIDSPEIHQIIPLISKEIEFLISQHHYAQGNHVLSVLMYQLVKKLRSLPDAEKHKINNAQAKISYLFAYWAFAIANYSLKWRRNKISHEKEFPINSNVIRLEKFVEAGVEIYENEFPCEVLVAREDFEKVLKKGKAWCQRAIDMYDKCPEEELLAKELMKEILEFQQTVDNLQDLP